MREGQKVSLGIFESGNGRQRISNLRKCFLPFLRIQLDDDVRVFGKFGFQFRHTFSNVDRKFFSGVFETKADLLIHEELLVQRGLELGYANEDRSIRSKIVSTVIQSILSEQVSKKPNELKLRIYFLSNQDKFLNSSRYKILVYAESNEDAAKKLSKAIRDGGSVSSASRVADVPGDFLPLRKLLDYLGSDGVEVLIRLKAGEVSEPILSGGRYLVLKILAIEPGFVPAFSAIKNEVETSYIQEKGNEALREYLDWLRSKSKVTIGDLKD